MRDADADPPLSAGLHRLHPSIAPRVNRNPLQAPGQDEKLRRVTVGGPDEPGDRAFYLDTGTLQHLLDVAHSTPTGQVMIPLAGLQVDVCRRRDGSIYEVWRVVGADPRPVPLLPLLRSGVGQG